MYRVIIASNRTTHDIYNIMAYGSDIVVNCETINTYKYALKLPVSDIECGKAIVHIRNTTRRLIFGELHDISNIRVYTVHLYANRKYVTI